MPNHPHWTPGGHVATDPRVQDAWRRVLDAQNAYAAACLAAAHDPAPKVALTDIIHGAELLRTRPGDDEVLTLRIIGPRGRFGSPVSLQGKRVVVYDDD